MTTIPRRGFRHGRQRWQAALHLGSQNNKTAEAITGTRARYGLTIPSSGYNHEEGLVLYHRNQQYSITAITDGSGGISERYAYSAYGTPTITDASGTTRTTTAIGNRYMYTGREWDETLALYHYRARMYDSVGGRFVSRDPLVFTSADIETYLYCRSSPLAYLDSNGLQAVAAGGGAPPTVGQSCELKFTWQFPVLGVPNLGIGQKMLDFAKCVLKETAANPPTSEQQRNKIRDDCFSETIGDAAVPPTRGATEALANTYCCLSLKEKGNHRIDPCAYGTHEGDPPGTKPRRFPCWDPKDPTDPPNNPFCGECCDFRACVDGILPVLSVGLHDNGSAMDNLKNCNARCQAGR